ncbi:MAG: TetR/AcrR family transcriptional regulator [Deltaproteobacteria bacterium]|nr:TetR/AcrR family transcriptional regulator [Deltaproteobacteria bacterium]
MNKKEQILQEIAELFYVNGYEKTSIRDISNALNISKPGLYYHFTNKQEILFDMIYDFMEGTNLALFSELSDISTPEKRLFCIIKNHIESFIKHPARMRVLVYEAHSLEGNYYERFRQKQREYIVVIKEVLQKIMDKHDSGRNINVVTFTLLGMLNWIIQWYEPGGAVSPGELAEEMYSFFINGLKSR